MRKSVIALAVLAAAASGCTRIETGHVGVRVTFNGTYEPQELGVGFHQTVIGDVKTYIANEMRWEVKDLHPQTKDNTVLEDLDLMFTYSVDSASIAELIVKFKGQDVEWKGDHYPLARYISNVVTTAASDVIGRYDALTANNNREMIRDQIKAQVDKILHEEKLDGKIHVHQLFVQNLMISKQLQASALAVITAQNELKTKDFEVQTARKEAERLEALAKNPTNIDYMRAKALADIAEGVKNGKVNSIVIPADFRGLLSVTGK